MRARYWVLGLVVIAVGLALKKQTTMLRELDRKLAIAEQESTPGLAMLPDQRRRDAAHASMIHRAETVAAMVAAMSRQAEKRDAEGKPILGESWIPRVGSGPVFGIDFELPDSSGELDAQGWFEVLRQLGERDEIKAYDFAKVTNRVFKEVLGSAPIKLLELIDLLDADGYFEDHQISRSLIEEWQTVAFRHWALRDPERALQWYWQRWRDEEAIANSSGVIESAALARIASHPSDFVEVIGKARGYDPVEWHPLAGEMVSRTRRPEALAAVLRALEDGAESPESASRLDALKASFLGALFDDLMQWPGDEAFEFAGRVFRSSQREDLANWVSYRLYRCSEIRPWASWVIANVPEVQVRSVHSAIGKYWNRSNPEAYYDWLSQLPRDSVPDDILKGLDENRSTDRLSAPGD